MTARRALVGVAAMSMLVAACGDDDEEAGGGDVAAYCAAVEEVESTDEPTVEQIEAIRDAAPEEISDDIDFIADRFVEAIEAGDVESVFADEEVGRRLEESIEPFEEENCPNDDGGEDENGDGDDDAAAGEIDPEFAEYCAAAAELDEQDGPPTEEQLRALVALAPDEIAEDLTLAAEAFIERGEAALDDPVVGESFQRVEEFEAEACGREDEEVDDLGASDEVEPDAQQVAVSAVEYDFVFEAPSAGRTSFVMTNDGEESHFMFLVAIAEGVTFEEAFAAEGEGGTIVGEAESDVATPGGEAVLTVDLEPGDYGMLCFITAPDGEPHADKGMAVPFTVS